MKRSSYGCAAAMPVISNVIIILAVLGIQVIGSPFNSYSVFLEKAGMSGGCSITDTEHFRNRAYFFRAWTFVRPPMVLHDGKALDLDALGNPEWETELLRQSIVSIGGQSAIMLRFIASHVGGTGSWGMVLIGTCTNRQFTVGFEVASQGLTEAAFTADHDLVVKRAVWLPSDAHASPSREAEERYRWDRNMGRFVLIRTY